MVSVAGKGDVVEDQGSKLGDYRSPSITLLEIVKSQQFALKFKDIQKDRI